MAPSSPSLTSFQGMQAICREGKLVGRESVCREVSWGGKGQAGQAGPESSGGQRGLWVGMGACGIQLHFEVMFQSC